MDRYILMQRLSALRQEAEAAHLDIVVQSGALADIRARGGDMAGAQARLDVLKMAEQRALRELDWVLDRLDSSES